MGKFTNIATTLYSYFNSFLPSYLEGTVPENASFPYGVYSLSYDDNYEDNIISYRIWTQSSSLVQVATFSDAVAEDIGFGKIINCKEGGTIWLKAGSPFQQFVADEDATIKTVYMNIIINYLV